MSACYGLEIFYRKYTVFLYYSLLNTSSAKRGGAPDIGGPVTQLYQVARYYCFHGQVIKIDKPVPDVLWE